MTSATMNGLCSSSVTCAQCGTPLDAQYFDESGVADAPAPGRLVVLARFELPPQYCGVLQYFSQFTDAFGESPAQIETPGLLWSLVVNQRPLYPYVQFDRIVNPWGYGSFQVALRLDDSATLEFVVRGSTTQRFTTSIPAAVTGSPAEQAITPVSMTGIKAGSRLIIGTGADEEGVVVTSVTATAFRAIVRNDHAAGASVSEAGTRKVGGRIVGRYWYNPAYGDVERRR